MKENLVKLGMALFEGKKVNMVGVKLSQSMEDIFQEICKDLDRPMSYVVRELALRGLAQYIKDGQLKMTDADEKAIQTIKSLKTLNLDGKELAVSSKKKIPLIKDGDAAEKAA